MNEDCYALYAAQVNKLFEARPGMAYYYLLDRLYLLSINVLSLIEWIVHSICLNKFFPVTTIQTVLHD